MDMVWIICELIVRLFEVTVLVGLIIWAIGRLEGGFENKKLQKIFEALYDDMYD